MSEMSERDELGHADDAECSSPPDRSSSDPSLRIEERVQDAHGRSGQWISDEAADKREIAVSEMSERDQMDASDDGSQNLLTQNPPRPICGERWAGEHESDEREDDMSERDGLFSSEEEDEAASAAWRVRFYAARAAVCVPF